MRINIHAGHNGHTPGASGCLDEVKEDRKITARVIQLLRAQGHTVYDCTDNDGRDQDANLHNIVAKCNAHSVDLDVSIHLNCYNGSAHGTEVWVHTGSTVRKTAQRIVDNIAALGFTNRGVKETSTLWVIKKTVAPALLIETCFCDSKVDAAIYNYEKMAKAIVEGITGKKISTTPLVEVIAEKNPIDFNPKCQTDYPNVAYGKGYTIATSGCGPTSLRNALEYADIADVSVEEMCKLAISCGARTPGQGTDMEKLIKAAAKKWGFTYKETDLNAEALAHAKKNLPFIANQGDTNLIFANGGHFVTALGVDADGKIIVADPYWSATKYKTWPEKRSLCEVVKKGMVRCSIETLGKATVGRHPCYYLICPKPQTFRVELKTNTPVREKPDKNSRKIKTMKKGSRITVVEVSSGGGWYKRKHGGWVAASHCKKV